MGRDRDWDWDKLDERVRTGPGCWTWTGARNPSGYGRFTHKRKTYQAHRVVYELLVGPIAPGMQLDHLCKNPSCVNPEHLEPVTQKENLRRGNGWAGVNARKESCPAGHPYSGDNLIVRPTGRYCRECNRIGHIKRQRAKRELAGVRQRQKRVDV